MKTIIVLSSLVILISCSTIVLKDKIEFRTLADMNSNRYGFSSVTDSINIYAVCGGINVSPYFSNSLEKYDIAANTWSVQTESLIPRRYSNAEYITSQHKIFIFNGEYADKKLRGLVKQVESIDPYTGQITVGKENPQPVTNAGSDVWDNKIYFFGGQDSHGFSDRVWEYDPAKAVWKRLPDMPIAKQTSGKIIDGILYTFGGYDGHQQQLLSKINAYSIKESKWMDLGDLPVPVSAHATVAEGSRIWLVGCYDDLKYLAYYDTKTREFKKFDSNMIARRHASAQVVDNILYVIGGNQTNLGSSALASTQSADVALIK